MLSETPATIAISFTPSAVATLPAISGGNSECICRGWLTSLIFQSSFMSLTFVLFRIVSLRCHAVRCGSPPSVNQSAFFCCALGATIQVIAAASPARPAINRRVIDATPHRRCLYQNLRPIHVWLLARHAWHSWHPANSLRPQGGRRID